MRSTNTSKIIHSQLARSGSRVAQFRSLSPILKPILVASIFSDSEKTEKHFFGFKNKRQHKWNNNESSAMSGERKMVYLTRRKMKNFNKIWIRHFVSRHQLRNFKMWSFMCFLSYRDFRHLTVGNWHRSSDMFFKMLVALQWIDNQNRDRWAQKLWQNFDVSNSFNFKISNAFEFLWKNLNLKLKIVSLFAANLFCRHWHTWQLHQLLAKLKFQLKFIKEINLLSLTRFIYMKIRWLNEAFTL